MEDLVDKDFDLSWVANSERFKNKIRTTMPTIQFSDKKAVDEFQAQEAIRIGMPLTPFEYKLGG
jgi:hypothetical protein